MSLPTLRNRIGSAINSGWAKRSCMDKHNEPTRIRLPLANPLLVPTERADQSKVRFSLLQRIGPARISCKEHFYSKPSLVDLEATDGTPSFKSPGSLSCAD